MPLCACVKYFAISILFLIFAKFIPPCMELNVANTQTHVQSDCRWPFLSLSFSFHEYMRVRFKAVKACAALRRRFWHNIPNSRNLVIGFAVCRFHYESDVLSLPPSIYLSFLLSFCPLHCRAFSFVVK